MVTQATGPIFILGVTPRSGTNFLMDLLFLHYACAPGRHPVKEDFLLEHSDLLLDYTNLVRACWDPMWGRFTPALMADFRRALGYGLTSFLWVDRDRRLVTKTRESRTWRAKAASSHGAYRIRGILGDVSRPVRIKLGWTHDS